MLASPMDGSRRALIDSCCLLVSYGPLAPSSHRARESQSSAHRSVSRERSETAGSAARVRPLLQPRAHRAPHAAHIKEVTDVVTTRCAFGLARETSIVVASATAANLLRITPPRQRFKEVS